MSDNNNISLRVGELLQDVADSKNIGLVGCQKMPRTGARDCDQARFEAVRFELFDRVTVVCRGQEVARHEDEDWFARHVVV